MRSATVPPAGACVDLLRHLVVPAAAIALPLAAMLERLQAQAMREVIGEPFVLAALARGVPRSRIVWRGALKAALRPVASVYGLVIGTLLSGSFAVEVITAWPGLGTPDAGGAARARRLSGGRLRRRRRRCSWPAARWCRISRSPRRSARARDTGGARMTRRLGLALVGARAAGGGRRAGRWRRTQPTRISPAC